MKEGLLVDKLLSVIFLIWTMSSMVYANDQDNGIDEVTKPRMSPVPAMEVGKQYFNNDKAVLYRKIQYGTMNIRELNREMNWHLPIDGPKTLNGLIIEYLQDIPSSGVSFRIDGYPIEVLEVDHNMIKRIRIIPELFEPKANPNIDTDEDD